MRVSIDHSGYGEGHCATSLKRVSTFYQFPLVPSIFNLISMPVLRLKSKVFIERKRPKADIVINVGSALQVISKAAVKKCSPRKTLRCNESETESDR